MSIVVIHMCVYIFVIYLYIYRYSYILINFSLSFPPTSYTSLRFFFNFFLFPQVAITTYWGKKVLQCFNNNVNFQEMFCFCEIKLLRELGHACEGRLLGQSSISVIVSLSFQLS